MVPVASGPGGGGSPQEFKFLSKDSNLSPSKLAWVETQNILDVFFFFESSPDGQTSGDIGQFPEEVRHCSALTDMRPPAGARSYGKVPKNDISDIIGTL